MKVHLLHPSADLDWDADPPTHADTLIDDLGLDVVFETMAAGDRFLDRIVRRVLLDPTADLEVLRHRQGVLADCLDHPDVVRELYTLTVEAATSDRRRRYHSFSDRPTTRLSSAVRLLDFLVDVLGRLRGFADTHHARFTSTGFTALFTTLRDQLDDDYLDALRRHVERLRLPRGVRFTARLGRGLKPVVVRLHEPSGPLRWYQRVLPTRHRGYTLTIPPRDTAGADALGELRDRALHDTADAVGQATDHIDAFLTTLRRELALYVACLNLHDRLTATGAATCLPDLAPVDQPTLNVRGLYEVGLRLRTEERVVANDLDADGRSLVVVTGANQGGKSTFLRSVGLATLLAQSGVFVPADRAQLSVARQLFTHFEREEDPTMRAGKLDEELGRMSRIADAITARSTLLLNESFASTNEREGSNIAYDVLRPLRARNVRVLYVTHLYELAQRLYHEADGDDLFLRAERTDDGRRTFRMIPAPPEPTSHGTELYEEILASDDDDLPATVAGGP